MKGLTLTVFFVDEACLKDEAQSRGSVFPQPQEQGSQTGAEVESFIPSVDMQSVVASGSCSWERSSLSSSFLARFAFRSLLDCFMGS